MTDEELIDFLGMNGYPRAAEVVAKFTAEKRASYERMATLEREIELWIDGVGPKPAGVLMDFQKRRGKRHGS